MKSTKLNLTAAALAVSVAMGAGFASQEAQAEVTASLGASNMYLWRGQNLTPDGGQIHGGLNFASKVGVYGGIWASSEEGGHETDLYVGYGGEAGKFTYDVSYWKYWYPEEGTNQDLGNTDNSELVLSGTYGPVTATAYINVESDTNDDDYFTVAGSFEDFTLTYGWWDTELASGNDYSHITLGYSFNDELSFAVSVADNDVPDASGVETDPLFQVAWAKSFDLK